MELIGIIIVSIVSYFIGKLFYALVGNEKGCLGNILWGLFFLAVICSGNWILIVVYLIISVMLFAM
jgi:hypothetical protein